MKRKRFVDVSFEHGFITGVIIAMAVFIVLNLMFLKCAGF